MGKEFWTDWRPGVLVFEQIKALIDNGVIKCTNPSIGNSSIDLHLSASAWVMKGSLKLRVDEAFSSIQKSSNFIEKPLDLSEPQVLEACKTYVIQLQEEIVNPPSQLELRGLATGKSSIGRLDVLVRLIADYSDTYDKLPDKPKGSLWVEVTPITFPIIVKENDVLNQLRLFRGNPDLCKFNVDEVRLMGDIITSDRDDKRELTLDLSETDISCERAVAFTTKETRFGDEEALDLAKKGKLNPAQYWKPISKTTEDSLLIEKEHFYILRSKERFRLPKDVAVYCRAITENLGEIRIHYAGFVHPAFGRDRPDGKEGTPLIFEVRGHTVDAFLRNCELMAMVEYYRTSQQTDHVDKSYNEQELNLSSYFQKWNS